MATAADGRVRAHDPEGYWVARFQTPLNLADVIHRIHGLTIDCNDNVVFHESDIVRERTALDASHRDAAFVRSVAFRDDTKEVGFFEQIDVVPRPPRGAAGREDRR